MKNLKDMLNESLLNEASAEDKEMLYQFIDLIKQLVKKSRVKEVSRKEGVYVKYEYDKDLFYDIKDRLEPVCKGRNSIVTMDNSSEDYFAITFNNLGIYIEVSEDVPVDDPTLRIGFYPADSRHRSSGRNADAKQTCIEAYKHYMS